MRSTGGAGKCGVNARQRMVVVAPAVPANVIAHHVRGCRARDTEYNVGTRPWRRLPGYVCGNAQAGEGARFHGSLPRHGVFSLLLVYGSPTSCLETATCMRCTMSSDRGEHRQSSISSLASFV